jgi:hypothetical protein
LVFKREAQNKWMCMKAHGRFLEYDRGRSVATKKISWNPIIQVFHSWMCKRILGSIRETKITNTELNWLYSALIAR